MKHHAWPAASAAGCCCKAPESPESIAQGSKQNVCSELRLRRWMLSKLAASASSKKACASDLKRRHETRADMVIRQHPLLRHLWDDFDTWRPPPAPRQHTAATRTLRNFLSRPLFQSLQLLLGPGKNPRLAKVLEHSHSRQDSGQATQAASHAKTGHYAVMGVSHIPAAF